MTPKKRTIALAIFCLLAFFFHQAYVKMYIESLRTEAKIIIAYILSLEKAYYSEHNKYVYFSEPYGAPIMGSDNCIKPEGAKKLGFTLNWCDKGIDAVYYAYKVLPSGPKKNELIIVAESGSNKGGKSFVCFYQNNRDHLKMEIKDPQPISLESCKTIFNLFD